MIGNLSKAKSICTTAEWQLLYQSTEKRIEVLSESQLRSKLARARKLRDKYRTLAHKQKRSYRGKASARGADRTISNANTVRKNELFAAALKRFEVRLKELAAKEKTRKAATRKAGTRTVRGARTGRAKDQTADKQAESTGSSSKSSEKMVVRKPSVVVAMASATTSGKPLRLKSSRTRAMRSRGRQVEANFIKINAHVSARGRRNQAKRDSK